MLFPALDAALIQAIDAAPAALRALILAPLFFFGVWAAGIRCTAWSTGARSRSVLVIVGFLLGGAGASVVLNALGLIFGWHAAVMSVLALGILSLRPSWRALRESERDPDWRSLVRAWKWLVPAIGILAVVTPGLDTVAHYAFQTLIGRGNWPLRFPYEPTQPFSYHVGFDVVAAPFVTLGLPSPAGSIIWLAAWQWALVSLAFLAAGGWLRETAGRWWVVAVWLLTESMGWFMRPFRGMLPHALQNLAPLYSAVTHSIFVTTYSRSFLPAFSAVLLFLWWARAGVAWRLRHVFPLVILLAATALSSETIMVALVPFLSLGLLWLAPTWRARVGIVAALAVSAVIVVAQGGLLSDAVLTRFSPNVASAALTENAAVGLRASWDIQLFGGEALDVRSPFTWLRLAFELGGGLILFICAFAAWKRWDVFSRWMLVGAAFAFAPALLLVYAAAPVNILRFFGHAFLIANFFGAVALASWLRLRWQRSFAFGFIMLGGVLTLLYYTVAQSLPLRPFLEPSGLFSPSPALWTPFLRQDYVPRGSVLWVSLRRNRDQFPPLEMAQTTVIFGAYLQNCVAYALHDTSVDCEAFYSAPDAAGLRRLGVTHLLLEPAWIRAHASDDWFALLEPVAHYTVPPWSSFTPSWWRSDLRDWTLYRVKT